MSVIDIINKRKSIRSYSDKNILDKDLNLILEAGRLAPSAKNLQNWNFLIIKNKEIMQQLVPICKNQKFVGEANTIIIGYSEYTDYVMTCGQNAYTIDISIAITHMMLQATELGIGSCWLGAFYEDQAKKLLNIPNHAKIVAMLTLGYAKNLDIKKTTNKSRKSINEIAKFIY